MRAVERETEIWDTTTLRIQVELGIHLLLIGQSYTHLGGLENHHLVNDSKHNSRDAPGNQTRQMCLYPESGIA